MGRGFLDYAEKHEIEFIHFEITDLSGSLHRITAYFPTLKEEVMEKGLKFDSTLIKGLEGLENVDLAILPDNKSFYEDPLSEDKNLIVKCNIVDQSSQELFSGDSRYISQKAESYLKGFREFDRAFFGVGLEFFIFDDIRFINNPGNQYVYIESEELPYNYNKISNNPNSGHRSERKAAYLNVSPKDTASDIRGEIMRNLKEIGIVPLFHYHAASPSQYEIVLDHSNLSKTADDIQNFKYIVKNTVASFGKTATFMPQPIMGENGSGLNICQSLWKNDINIFQKNTGLSEVGLWYLGGIVKHRQSLAAFSNATTNSYKRPASSLKCHELSTHKPYIKTRFADSASNPYLLLAATLMAGLDGIENKIDPSKIIAQSNQESCQFFGNSLKESLVALERDYEFLVKGNVFNKEIIKLYIDMKMKEITHLEKLPHPEEFNMYYSS